MGLSFTKEVLSESAGIRAISGFLCFSLPLQLFFLAKKYLPDLLGFEEKNNH